MKLNKDEYFSDDCVVQDDLYISIKELIICPLCNKIYKEPYMCLDCQSVYCKKCLENYSNLKKCPKDGKNNKFVNCITKNDLISKLKYRCKNCLKEVIQADIKSHLEEKCKHSEKIGKEKTLAEIIKTKKELIILSQAEMEDKEIDNSITSKNVLYNIN